MFTVHLITTISAKQEGKYQMYKSIKPTLFMVEGHHEEDFLRELTNRNLCRENKIVRFNLNGRDVPIQALALKIGTLVTMHTKKREHYPIVVLFDREGRKESYEEIAAKFKSEISKLGYDETKFIVGVADRKFDSWILPFVDKEGNFPVSPTKFSDGINSKRELEKRLKRRKIVYNIREIRAKVLLSIEPEQLASISDSFQTFYKEVNTHCKWMNRKKPKQT